MMAADTASSSRRLAMGSNIGKAPGREPHSDRASGREQEAKCLNLTRGSLVSGRGSAGTPLWIRSSWKKGRLAVGRRRRLTPFGRTCGRGNPCPMKKVHVNVGTIGHIDHGKTTLTAAILAVQATEGPGRGQELPATSPGAARSATPTKTVTIITSHVEYETATRHYAHIDCPGPRRLREEHDHRGRPDGRRGAAALGRRRPDAADPRAHPARPAGRRAATWSCSSTRSIWWTTRT